MFKKAAVSFASHHTHKMYINKVCITDYSKLHIYQTHRDLYIVFAITRICNIFKHLDLLKK